MIFTPLISLLFIGLAVFFAETLPLFILFITLFFLVISIRIFSKRILLKTFNNKKLIQNTSFFRLAPLINEELKEISNNDLEIFVYEDKKDIQFYFIDTKPLTVAFSSLLLKVHSPEELRSLLKGALLVHKSHNFNRRQKLVAFFLYLGGIFKNIDALLCFILGINTNNGEPKMVTRLITSPILNWFCSSIVPGAEKSAELKKLKAVHLIKSQSYLDTRHLNPLFSPLSLTDYILYQD